MQVQAIKVNVSQFELSKAITFSKLFSKIKLTPSARLVLRCLTDHWNQEKQYCFPKQNTLSDETGCSRKSVNDAIKELRLNGLILTTGEKGESLKYYLTNNFFDLIKTSQACAKNAHTYVKTSQHEQIKPKQINNKTSFQKNNFKTTQKPVNEISYLTPYKTKEMLKQSQEIKKGSPLDLAKDEAVAWYSSLPEILKNSYFAKEIRKKWNLK
jgi:DNA-binding transcriptional regulator GbsR (MarR family)